jgi:hypothetical protein
VGDVLEEREEFLVEVPVLAQPGHLPGGDVERGEQRGDAVAKMVVDAVLCMTRAA